MPRVPAYFPAPRQRGGGTARRAVGGARDSTISCAENETSNQTPPPPRKRAVPLPRVRAGADAIRSRSRGAFRARAMSNSECFERPVSCSADRRAISGAVADLERCGAHSSAARFRQKKERKRNAGRRVVHDLYANGAQGAPRKGGLRRPSASGALACRRSTTALAAATERHRSAPVHALPGTELGRGGRYPPPAVPVQRAL